MPILIPLDISRTLGNYSPLHIHVNVAAVVSIPLSCKIHSIRIYCKGRAVSISGLAIRHLHQQAETLCLLKQQIWNDELRNHIKRGETSKMQDIYFPKLALVKRNESNL